MPVRRDLTGSIGIALARTVLRIAVLLALLCVDGAGAQSLEVRLGFDGAFVHGRWSPLRVDVSAGGEPFSGWVEVDVPRTTLLSVEPAYVKLTAPVDLEARATKQLWLSVPLQATPYPLVARLVNRAGETVSAREVALKEAAVPDGLTLVLDPTGERWTWLAQGSAGSGRETTPVTLARPADVPSDPLTLMSLSSIVISDDFPVGSLSPAQLAALHEYVLSGGTLVLTGGSTPPSLPSALVRWLPNPPTGRVVPIAAGAASVPAWELDAPREAVTFDAGGVPLVVQGTVGAGRVTVVAVDPVPLSSRSLLSPDAWTAALLGDGARRWVDASPADQEEVWRILGRARIETPAPLLLQAILAAYVVVTIAALYYAPRGKPAVLTACWLVFAGSALAWGIASRSVAFPNRTGFAELQVTREIDRGIAVNRTYGMVASGSPVPFDLDVTAATSPPFPGAAGRASVEAAVTPEGIQFQAIRPGESVRFIHENIEPFPVTAVIERGEQPSVRVENRGEHPLRFAYLVGRDWYTPLGTIEAGRTLTVPVPRQAVQGSSSFVTLSIQSHLERLETAARPSSLEARVILFAVGQAQNDALYAGRRDAPLLVALTEPRVIVAAEPSGRPFRLRVIVAPFAEQAEGGVPRAK